MSVLQDLYHSEINFRISTFWDGGFDLELGDDSNGIVAHENVSRWGMVETWFISSAIEHFPSSLFAKMYRDGHHAWLASSEEPSPTDLKSTDA